jgi:predicted secreted protein
MEPKHKTGLALAVAVLVILPMTLLSKCRPGSFETGGVSSGPDDGAGLRVLILVVVSVVIFVVAQKFKK